MSVDSYAHICRSIHSDCQQGKLPTCLATMSMDPRNYTHDGDELQAWFILTCTQKSCVFTRNTSRYIYTNVQKSPQRATPLHLLYVLIEASILIIQPPTLLIYTPILRFATRPPNLATHPIVSATHPIVSVTHHCISHPSHCISHPSLYQPPIPLY
jgi:hypothetical protein